MLRLIFASLLNLLFISCSETLPTNTDISTDYVSKEWAGTWEITSWNRDCVSDSARDVSVEVRTLCEGDSSQFFVSKVIYSHLTDQLNAAGISEPNLNCTQEFFTRSFSAFCRGITFSGNCQILVDASLNLTIEDSVFAGYVTITSTRCCFGPADDNCSETSCSRFQVRAIRLGENQ